MQHLSEVCGDPESFLAVLHGLIYKRRLVHLVDSTVSIFQKFHICEIVFFVFRANFMVFVNYLFAVDI